MRSIYLQLTDRILELPSQTFPKIKGGYPEFKTLWSKVEMNCSLTHPIQRERRRHYQVSRSTKVFPHLIEILVLA